MKQLYGMRNYGSDDIIELYFLTIEEAEAMREAFRQADRMDGSLLSLVLIDTVYSVEKDKTIEIPTPVKNEN